MAKDTVPSLTPPKAPSRPRFTFKVPESARLSQDDPTSVTLVPVTIEEEQMALRASEANKTPLGHELAKMSLVAANGKVLDWANGERDALFGKCSPQVRQLVLTAWSNVNVPKPEVEQDFLASRQMELG